MDFDFRQLETFCKVVELGSFTRAAEEVSLAQASVSERIANLERAVGARLLDRLGKRVEPSVVGRRLYERAVELLERKQAICFELEELLGVEQGVLVIGASTIPGEYILPAEIARFHEEHPGVLIRVRGGDTTVVADLVAGGEVEIGFVGSRTDHETLSFRPWRDDELVLAVSSGHRWARRKSIGLTELEGEPFVLREPGSGTRLTMERAMSEAAAADAVALNVVAELGSTQAIKQAVLEGLGVSMLSLRALTVEIEAGRLRALRIDGVRARRSFYLVEDARRARSPLCERFEASLRESSA